MKTEERSFIFSKEQVQQYVQMLGDSNPVYESEVNAQQSGFKTIPLPPVMPMTVFQLFETPWTMQMPVILRKQQCTNDQKMYIGEIYTGYISLTDVRVRKGHTFSKQTLLLHDENGNLCFSGISHIVSGGIV